MIDLKYLQNNFDEASQKLQKKGVDSDTLQNLKTLFASLKTANAAFESAKAEQNKMSKLFGEYKREGKDISELKAKVDVKKEEISILQETARQAVETCELALSGVELSRVAVGRHWLRARLARS